MLKNLLIGLLIITISGSCRESKKESIIRLVKEWKDKSIIFPDNALFASYIASKQDFDIPTKNKEYSVFMYVDSIGCLSCKLQLSRWKELINTFDSVSESNISFFFVFHPKYKMDLIDLLRRNSFNYPVCIDEDDAFNRLNHFPSEMNFQTFLLDKNNKILAIGNPLYNPKIKDLYLNIIQEKKICQPSNSIKTIVRFPEKSLNLGSFNWNIEQKREFEIQNIGNNLLIIEDIITSCGCLKVDYPKEPIQSGKRAKIKIYYKAEQAEHFNKIITIFCNTEGSPFQLKVIGNAKY